jgi:hypothetical protein
VGTQWLAKALTESGRPDVMYRIASNKTYPSWGYMVEKGATTIWEVWNGDTAGGGMNSHNHVMMVGDLIIWLYEDLAGIRTDPERRGFKQIQIKPLPVGDLTWVKASYESLHGRIATHWKRENGRFSLEVTIPANTTAEVFVPTKDANSVTESGKPAAQAKGVKFLRMQNDAAVYAIGSGTYRFETAFPEKSNPNTAIGMQASEYHVAITGKDDNGGRRERRYGLFNVPLTWRSRAIRLPCMKASIASGSTRRAAVSRMRSGLCIRPRRAKKSSLPARRS